MANSLEQLKKFTTVVADTGDINGESEMLSALELPRIRKLELIAIALVLCFIAC